ncbi:hypothetical protein R20233_02362 [Ralstonia sp. LMG 32965]|uniref:hypothetical protein n=1 Tax=Ralstonia flatus TaxID=3058601 RepID=UPI0028F5CE87|nr:hypothetical protein [Ralstonia sp. LMG 32965]CAJ0877829.1 hypothetical protein R20233_02362 [Ralstonia sp. LMG 32965]
MGLSTVINERIAELAVTIGNLQRERNELLQRYASNPSDANLSQRLEAILGEINGIKVTTAELQEARLIALDRESESERQANGKQAEEYRSAALKVARSRVKIAGEINDTIRHLGTLLERWRAEGETCHTAIKEVSHLLARSIGLVQPHIKRGIEDSFRGMRAEAMGDDGGMREAFCHALFCVLGAETNHVVGIDIRRHLDPPNQLGTARPRLTLEDAARLAADRLSARLSDTFRQAEFYRLRGQDD